MTQQEYAAPTGVSYSKIMHSSNDTFDLFGIQQYSSMHVMMAYKIQASL